MFCDKCNKDFKTKTHKCKKNKEEQTLKNTKQEEKKETEEKAIKIEIINEDGLKFLETIKDGSVDLILTDPPYIISKDTGMDKHYNKVKENEKNNIEFVKTYEEWL